MGVHINATSLLLEAQSTVLDQIDLELEEDHDEEIKGVDNEAVTITVANRNQELSDNVKKRKLTDQAAVFKNLQKASEAIIVPQTSAEYNRLVN